MSTEAEAQIQRSNQVHEREGFPAGERGYDWIYAILSALFVAGIYLVGWATTHNSSSPGLFTWWYALPFAGFALLIVILIVMALRYHSQGYPWKRALPLGYTLSLPGACLFIGGIAGMQVWQAVVGGLNGLETLLLPTTLAALFGAILIVSGPLRHSAGGFTVKSVLSWRTMIPLLFSLTWVLSLCTFLTQFAHPWVQPYAASSTTTPTVFSDIYTMRANGTSQTRLTTNPQRLYFGPSWSPDGHKIAFAFGPGDGMTNLYVMNADGTNPIQLTHLTLNCYLQQWSPDGTRLVFIAQTGSDVNTAAIYTLNADGSNLQRLTHENAREYGAVWSPDGKQIAFGSLRGGTWHIYVMNADGSALHLLTSSTSGNKPTWSPDGRSIAFTSDDAGHNDIYVMNANGSNAHLLTQYGDHSAWSPDGQHIAFVSNRTGNDEIYIMNADGSGATNLTRNPGVDNLLPGWSPDSREITYMTQRQTAQTDLTTTNALGIASFIIQAALLVGCILWLVRRWRLSFGALTLVITLNGLLLSLLGDQYTLLPALFVAGLVADLLYWWLNPGVEQPVRFALFATCVPLVWSALYFLTIFLTQGIGWSFPLWTGAIVMAGLTGLAVNFLVTHSFVARK